MKKIHLIFSSLLLVELAIIIFAVASPVNCGSLCGRSHSFTNPFGIERPGRRGLMCPAVCVEQPRAFFYITVDIFVLTAILYIASLAIGKKNMSNNNGVHGVQEEAGK